MAEEKPKYVGIIPYTYKYDVFQKGLPFGPAYYNGWNQKQDEVFMTANSMRHALLGIPVLPGTLAANMRANLFPESIEKTIFSLKAGIFDYNLFQLAEYESVDKKLTGQENGIGLVTEVCRVDPTASVIPYGITHVGSTLIGSEIWEIARKDRFTESDMSINTNVYRVNYYTASGGDFFYTDVLPEKLTSFRGWFCFGILSARSMWKRFMMNDNSGPANEIALPQPPPRN